MPDNRDLERANWESFQRYLLALDREFYAALARSVDDDILHGTPDQQAARLLADMRIKYQ